MKRPGPPVYPAKLVEDIKQDLTPEQLAGIGAASLAFNAAERILDKAIAVSMGLTNSTEDFTVAKIGGVDDKVKLLKIIFEDFSKKLGLDLESVSSVHNTLNELLILKDFRNGAIHVTHIDTGLNVGIVRNRDGKTSRVLLTVQALDGLYERLVYIYYELDSLCGMFALESPKMQGWRATIDPMRMEAEPSYQQWLRKLKDNQNRRKALPLMPEVP